MKKNDIIVIRITDMSVKGEGIGRFDGMPFFVRNAITGDVIEAGVTSLKKRYGYARLIRIIEPSEHRCRPVCPVCTRCGGCSVMEMDYAKQLETKAHAVDNALMRIGSFAEEELSDCGERIIGMDEPYHFRNKAQYPVGRSDRGNIVAGFYAPYSHRIVELPEGGCAIGQPEDLYIIQIVKRWMDEKNISVYDEVKGVGLIRHIVIRHGFCKSSPDGDRRRHGCSDEISPGSGPDEKSVKGDRHQIMVVLVINGTSVPESDDLICSLQQVEEMHSIIANFNTTRGNVILGRESRVLWGAGVIEDELLGIRFEISPASFYQVNPGQTERLYQKAVEYAGLSGKEIVWDLYCGVGTISLCMAKRAARVYGIEAVEEAVENARRNASINDIDNAIFFSGRAEELLPQMCGAGGFSADGSKPNGTAIEISHREDATDGNDSRDESLHSEKALELPDVIVADPPRKGLDGVTIDVILKASPKRIVYVSCNPATLARDLAAFRAGGYELEKYTPVDQFGHSMHVETVCLLSNRKPDARVKIDVDLEDYYRIKDEQKKNKASE